MNPASPDFFSNASTRAGIAAELANYYRELTDLVEKTSRFSISKVLMAAANRTPLTGREAEVIDATSLAMGQMPDGQRQWIPFRALETRALANIPGGKGGYLTGQTIADPADTLRPWSVVASAGASLMVGLQDEVLIPRTTANTSATWIGENGSATSESPPTLGNVDLSPRTAIGLVKFSIQLLRQGAAVDSYISAQLLRAAGEILDIAYFAGTGGVQPLGLLNTAGIGTQSGSSLAHAGTLAMRRQVLNAGGREERLAWVGTPTVQEALGAREKATGGGRFLWDSDGILGRPAYATKNGASSALVCGDFSESTVGVFGPGLRIDIDPSQDFNSAGLVARVLLVCDVAFPQPAAFSVATSVS